MRRCRGLRQAKWLLEQNRQLIAEARKEYDAIVSDAKEQMTRMIDEHEITIQARNQADQLIDDANQSSRQIRASAINYTKDMLTELEDQLTEMLVFIQKNKRNSVEAYHAKQKTIVHTFRRTIK